MKLSKQGLELIKGYEGLRLEAYPDPGTGGAPWTIGYGTTAWVEPGMVITEEQAEELLLKDVRAFEDAVNRLMPISLSQSEFDALVSFTYNVGVYALESSTLRRRLMAGEPRCWVYQKEMPRWNKGGSGVLPGLTRRRQEEADLACLGYLSQPAQEIPPMPVMPATPLDPESAPQAFPLPVPYFYQLDSLTGHGERMCFSSSMAMALDYINPEAIQGDDDWYLQEVFKRGDTVSSAAQAATARALGFDAEFRMDGTEKLLLEILDSGVPVPVGILHRGPISQPSGGGHWVTLIGYDDTHFHVHDPAGELDLINGGYLGGSGENQRYTRKNLMKRWLIDGSGEDGWLMDLR